MLCARVMRGINSIAKKETPVAARAAVFLYRRERFTKTDYRLAGLQQAQDRRAPHPGLRQANALGQ